jgi:alginate O-acetyltransferase complex protein AlgI
MLFNSYGFIFVFLPIVFLGFFIIGKYSHELASLWLAAASLFFYGWWDIRFVGLLLGSIAFNYGIGYLISHRVTSQLKMLLAGAITVNLILLGYFKYANFFTDNLNYLAGISLPFGEVILPLGISFFTFTQIAFLVDTYQGKVKEYNFVHYTLFVTYFPHLIAGPVLHHKEMMPQFAKQNVCHINWDNTAVGLTIFVLGLAKKVLIADSLAGFSTPIFSAIEAGGHPMLIEAWIGALCYTFQLYFDFSAYSDMAIGLSLMFNVRLPVNFNSPYKATSIIDFWRRWHMTLSHFLRDYLYIPLGGNRNGILQRYSNLLITMLLGGLWHGANWTFVIWGGLHGVYLVINHVWRNFKQNMGVGDGGKLATFGSGTLTFLAVVIAWVLFRSDNMTSAIDMLKGMSGLNGISFASKLGESIFATSMKSHGTQFVGVMPLSDLNSGQAISTLLLAMVIAFKLPNLQQVFQKYKPSLDTVVPQEIHSRGWIAVRCIWQPTPIYAWLAGLLFVYAVLSFTQTSEFLYFRF